MIKKAIALGLICAAVPAASASAATGTPPRKLCPVGTATIGAPIRWVPCDGEPVEPEGGVEYVPAPTVPGSPPAVEAGAGSAPAGHRPRRHGRRGRAVWDACPR